MKTTLRVMPGCCAGVLLGLLGSSALAADEDLAAGFIQPPDAARPLTWWHWLDGNITRDGITADLEAMKRAGLGGALMFNAGVGMPQGPARFMQAEWLAMIDHTLRETERLGLQFGIHNCDGFSQSGGPWITPETSMKQLSWSVKEVAGPAAIDLALELPPAREDFYQDIAVIAFPAPQGGDLTGGGAGTALRGSVADAELAKLVDGNAASQALFPVRADGNRIEFVFPVPRTVRSLVCRNAAPNNWEEDFPITMEVSADGTNFRRVGAFTANWDFSDGGSITAACDDAMGTVFRLTFHNPWPLRIGGIQLSETARVHFGEAKAARMRTRGHGAERPHMDAFPGPSRDRALPPELTVAREEVKNLSSNMNAAGHLMWDVPPGRWRIMRVGYTSNGHHNEPATAEGRGLECDKLDARVVRAHLDAYVGTLVRRPDGGGGSLVAMEVDSWECGIQNWTAGFERRFRQQTGYDLLPYMPALLEGWIVDNADATERVLWDWRRFLADQLNANFFSVVAEVARQKGLSYVGEAAGRQQFLYDTAWMRNCAVPMGEMWNNTGSGQGVRVDNKVASSLAHTTGKTVVATEAYTSGGEHAGWDNHPFTMKPLGDKAFCAGVNQFVFHTFAHQPYPATGPGFTFASWGLNFNRSNTWWSSVHAWTAYLARCNFLLRQGHAVNDVLFYVGEDVPNRIAWRDELHPVLPPGYDFDGCDTRAVMEARVQGGRIVLPGGAEYRVLLLPDLPTMRPAVIRKVNELVAAGAVVSGPRPARSPSLTDIGAGDETVRQLAGKLWGSNNDRVFSGISFEEIFQRIGLAPDFEPHAAAGDAEILYTHRRVGGTEIYFVSNQKNRSEEFDAVFRAGGAPEWWDPATGWMRVLPDFRSAGGRVTVPMRLDPCGSAFIVFRGDRKPAPGKNWTEPQPVLTLAGPWQVAFPPHLGAPATATFDTLISFTDHPDPGIRFFSGTATYQKDMDISQDTLDGGREWYLDLGDVKVMAEVEWNGNNLGVLWKPPFRVRLDGAVRPGANRLLVRVTNLWRNRMIGDASLPDEITWRGRGNKGAYPARWPDWLLEGRPRPGGRIAFCTRKDVYPADAPLSPSGLLGPVTLQAVAR